MRITPARVLKAYKKTGLRPTKDIYTVLDWDEEETYNKWRKGKQTEKFNGVACALGALAIAESVTKKLTFENFKNKFENDGPEAFLSRYFKLPRNFINGFVNGFDNTGFNEEQQKSPHYNEGYQNGVAVRQVVFGKKTKKAA